MNSTITAKVSHKLLKKAQLLFNQSTQNLLNEVLQNCRRAKASLVELTLVPDGQGTLVTVRDNGEGISDPSSLLSLGESNWDQDTAGLESPAGMGFFSLCHLPNGVEVKSNGWATHIFPQTFRGEACAEVVSDPTAGKGTLISFSLPEAPAGIKETLANCLKYYPVKATVDGESSEQKNFLSGADYIHEFSGGRIGVYAEDNNSGWSWPWRPINFHGLTLEPATGLVLEKRTEARDNFSWPFEIRVDIKSNAALDLVLPSRDQVVENQKLADLRDECRLATYRFITHRGGAHHLPHKWYLEAKSMGADIPEAEPALRLARPTDCGGGRWSGPDPYDNPENSREGRDAKQPVTPDSILSKLGNGDLAALYISCADIPVLLNPDAAMEGYSWYPRRTAGKLVQKITTRDGNLLEESTNGMSAEAQQLVDDRRRPDDITLELTVSGEGEEETFLIPTYIAIDTSYTGEDGVRGGWLPSRSKLAKPLIDSHLLAALFFNYYSDGDDSDSYDTQRSEFDEDAEESLLRAFLSEKKAARIVAEQALNDWSVRGALADLGAKRITLEVRRSGIKIIPDKKPRQPKAAK